MVGVLVGSAPNAAPMPANVEMRTRMVRENIMRKGKQKLRKLKTEMHLTGPVLK
jgi:hypothetical protein